MVSDKEPFVKLMEGITECDSALMLKKQYGDRINDTYEVAKRDYMQSIKENVNTVVLISAIVLVISLVEIFLMLRSSFLRIIEAGSDPRIS